MKQITLQELYNLSFMGTDEYDGSYYRAIDLDVMAEFLKEKGLLDEGDL